MKVLLTADSVGGVWTYTIELTRALPDVDFVVATMGAAPTDAQRHELPDNVQLVTSSFKLEWMDEPWDDVASAGYWLLDLEAQHRPDLIHLNGYTHAALPFAAPKLLVAHSCVLSWWRAVKGEDAPSEWTRYRYNVQRGLQSADLVAAPSAAMLAALDDHYQFTTRRRVIRNGRSWTGVEPRADRATIFAAGRLWDEAKNLRTVVDAAPLLQWPVRIAGEGGAGATNVTCLGRLDEAAMKDAYGSTGIYLFPALYEPFGLSILEAALSGCALVIGDIPSLREIWGDAAIYVPPRDPVSIAAEVNALIADPALRRRMSSRAAERAGLYTAEGTARGYRETYGELLRSARVRRSAAGARAGAEARP